MEPSARLIVRRTSPRDIKMRDLYVTLDDEPERTLLYPRRLEFDLAPGIHRLRVTNRLVGKEETFAAIEGEEIVFDAGNAVRFGMLGMMLAALTAAYAVFLERSR